MKNKKVLWITLSVILILILIIGTAVFVGRKNDTTISSGELVATSATPKVLLSGEELNSGSVRPLVIYKSCIYYFTRSYENAEHLVGEYIGKTKQITEEDLIYDNYDGLAALYEIDLYKVNGYEDSVICEYDKNNNLVYFYQKPIDSETLADCTGETLFGEEHLDLKNKYDRTKDIKWWYADDKFDEEKGKKRIAKDVGKIDDIINSLYDAHWVKLNKEPSLDDLMFIEFPMKDKTSVEIYVYKDGYVVCPYVCDSHVFLKVDKSVVDEIYNMCV